MSKAFIEYKQFLKKHSENLSSYEIKLARLILENFATIERSSSAGGGRGKLIASLVSESDHSVEETLILDETSKTIAEGQINRLSKLSVKNFRGFSDEQIFEFKNPYTFVYGPNGSGKTSFCEALEYALLGSVHEADAKRIDLDKYIKNADTGQAELPVLKGITPEGSEVIVQSEPQVNEFCFIERNRIEGFARVSANTLGAQQRRLASLFGLEEFNAFVANFNERFDNYLDCEGKLKKRLSEKEKQVELHNQTLKNLPQQREEVQQQTNTLLSKYPDVTNLKELKEKLSGTKETEGLIQKNNAHIAGLERLKPKADPGIEELITSIQRVDSLIKERNKAKDSLQDYKDEISLKDLYAAILQNEEKFRDVCPACESEIFIDGKLAVPLNPYSNATKKVQKFEVAIKLEDRVNEINMQIPKEITFAKTKITQISTLVETIQFPRGDIIDALNQKLLDAEEIDKRLSDVISTIVYYFDVLNDFKEHLNKYNEEVTEAKEKSKKIKEENRLLDEILDKISRIRTKTEAIDENEKKAKDALEKFKQENEELIKQVEKEKVFVERNCQYHDAYVSLKSRLVEYNRQLPSVLASNLSDKAMEFYNAINRYDHPYDLLEEIKLPSSSGEKIIIRFKNGGNLDALHVLSEGHIRCLGLSILLAKNIEDNLPIVIFDDVVNAIDDEHRRGIIETILENESIKNKQLIITTHGEEFVKQLENNVPKKDYAKSVTRIDFLKTEELKKITVKLDQSRNYLVIAQQRLEEGQLRDSLANGRRALESLMNKLWKKLAKKYNVQLSVSMRSPERPPELMSTAQALRKFIFKHTVGCENVISSLDTLLGMKSKHLLEWNYLNKGTHEEERIEEFDRTVIKEMIELLVQIDDTVMNRQAEL
ncbi:ATPase [Oceanobacillus oncorhynchi subsp. incaldanensis]|uniref:AAA family ATPase n=1 Tax=Oceanobacillus oncorhynchi TaxID=545501 RepID=UPI001B11637A|nr:AAA family ATPase [Oceanobacillus oncorhynchi]GIO20601.1 ATPase [Oceanobacillus oncorhynchi subsp. incaldanensis]